MFQFIKKIKLAFAEKQELLNQIEYLKKRNEFLDNIVKDTEESVSAEACEILRHTIMSKAPNPQTQPRPTGGIMPYIPQPRPTGGGGSKIKNN